MGKAQECCPFLLSLTGLFPGCLKAPPLTFHGSASGYPALFESKIGMSALCDMFKSIKCQLHAKLRAVSVSISP